MKKAICYLLLSVLFSSCAYSDNSYKELERIPTVGHVENQKIIKKIADIIISALINRDYLTISKYIDETQGLLVTMFPVIATKYVPVFSRQEVADFKNSTKEYKWGLEEGSGEMFVSNPEKFFNMFMDIKLKRISKIGINKMLTNPGYKENQWEIFPDSVVLEYYADPGTDFSGLDWLSIRIILEGNGDSYSLVGLTSYHLEF